MTEEKKAENTNNTPQDKNDAEYKDNFWVKVLVITVVLVWVSLAAGSWVGRYVIDTTLKPDKDSYTETRDKKPVAWKTVVEIDKQGRYSKIAVPETDLAIDDFRNTDNPIPGIDDQYLATPNSKGLKPVQEPQKDDSKKEPAASASTATPPPITPTQTTPAATTPTVTATTTPTATATTTPSQEKTSEPKTTPSTSTGKLLESAKSSSYTIQLGSYSSQENAAGISRELEKKGYKTTIDKIVSGNKEFYKVKISSPATTEVEAKSRMEKLKQDGYDPIIIPQ